MIFVYCPAGRSRCAPSRRAFQRVEASEWFRGASTKRAHRARQPRTKIFSISCSLRPNRKTHREGAKRTGLPSRSARGPPAEKSTSFQHLIRVLPGTPLPALDKTPVGEPLQATPSSKNPKYALKWRTFFWRRVEAGLSIPSNCNKSNSFWLNRSHCVSEPLFPLTGAEGFEPLSPAPKTGVPPLDGTPLTPGTPYFKLNYFS